MTRATCHARLLTRMITVLRPRRSRSPAIRNAHVDDSPEHRPIARGVIAVIRRGRLRKAPKNDDRSFHGRVPDRVRKALPVRG